jgi:PAS domain S-box-containing protein
MSTNEPVARRSSHIGSWELHLEGSVETLHWSEETYRIFGYAPGEVPVTTALFYSHLPEPGRSGTRQSMLHTIRRGRPYNMEHRIVRRDGAERIVFGQGEVISTNANGKVLKIAGIIWDITELRQEEAALQHNNDQLRHLTAHLQNSREEERAAIAREIHEELGQQLTGLKLDLAWVHNNLKDSDSSIKEKIGSMLPLVQNAITAIRRISSGLRPGILDDFGLVNAIEWQAADFQQRTGITCSIASGLKGEIFDKKIAITLFRIFQESLANVARYAQAGKVHATIVYRMEHIEMTLADDGIDFDAAGVSPGQALSLMGMKERIAMINGHYSIAGHPVKGTVTTLRVPYLPA